MFVSRKSQRIHLQKMNKIITALITLIIASGSLHAQDHSPLLSGELMTDQRFLFQEKNPWAWNENRLTLRLDKSIAGNSRFYSEVWLRNIGLPEISSSSDLYNKGIVDPYNLEIREAYVQLNGFLTKNLDVTIGRQRIAWGTADVINPTDNLNPYDLEDILDFGRHRGSDALNLQYYFNHNFSLQAVFIPFFQPANLPIGIFAGSLNSSLEMPPGMTLRGFSDTIQMPEYNLGESANVGLRLKGFAGGIDFSLSYVWGWDGLPNNTGNVIYPVDLQGGVNVDAELSYSKNHIIGADLATSIAGIGVWAEAAAFIPEQDVTMSTDLSALFPTSPDPVTIDSTILESKPYFKFVVGGDYFFSDGSYLNLQYIHGFIHEKGTDALNDYFFLRYDKSFFNNKLKISPVSGAFIVTDWSELKNNYALAYMPEVIYQATPNTEISLSSVFFDGQGNNLFANMKNYDMFITSLMFHHPFSGDLLSILDPEEIESGRTGECDLGPDLTWRNHGHQDLGSQLIKYGHPCTF